MNLFSSPNPEVMYVLDQCTFSNCPYTAELEGMKTKSLTPEDRIRLSKIQQEIKKIIQTKPLRDNLKGEVEVVFQRAEKEAPITALSEKCNGLNNICSLLNREESNVSSFFKEYDLKTSTIKTMHKINSGVNGFVTEIIISESKFDKSLILKSNSKRSNDNLWYEYKVGLYLNGLLDKYPLFCKTYNMYRYASPEDKAMIQNLPKKDEMGDKETAKGVLKRLVPPEANSHFTTPEEICILIQNVPRAQTLKSLLDLFKPDLPDEKKKEMRYNILCILYQVYFVLRDLPDFSHNDLHTENVLAVEAENEYYHFVYIHAGKTVEFYCKYAVKIIDYGRCFFNGTSTIKTDLDAKFTLDKQREFGIDWYFGIGTKPCYQIDLLLFHICAHHGIIEYQTKPNFYSDSIDLKKNPSKSNIEFHFENDEARTCDNVAYMLNPVTDYLDDKMRSYLRKWAFRNNAPTLNHICNYLETQIGTEATVPDKPVVCKITVNSDANMIIEWTKSGGRKRRKTRKSKTRKLKRKTKRY